MKLNSVYDTYKNMLQYDRIDLSKGIDANKTSNSRECSFCHYYYFLDINLNYQKYLCDGCHYMSMKANNMQNLAIVYSHSNAYRINFTFMDLNEPTYLLNNSNKNSKKGTL